MIGIEWEAVRNPQDRRCVVYWRAQAAGVSVGAISRTDNAWKATGYPPGFTRGHTRPAELGEHRTRSRAERAVQEFTTTHHTTEETR